MRTALYASNSCDSFWTIRDILSNYRSTEDGSTASPETSVRNYHYSLRNDPEESSSHLLRGGRLKSQLEHVPVKSVPGSPSCFFTIDFVDHHFCMQRLFLFASMHSTFPIHFGPLLYSFTVTIKAQIMMLRMMSLFNQHISNNNYCNDKSYNKLFVSVMRLVDRLSTVTEL